MADDTPEPAEDDELRRRRLEAMVASMVDGLRAHWDTVQVFVSKADDNGTLGYQYGNGNWYARVEQARRFVVKNDEDDRCDARADYKHRNEENGDEDWK